MKKPYVFSTASLLPSARYFAIYLIIVLPNPKLNSDKYETADCAREYNPYSDCPRISSIMGVYTKGINELIAKLKYEIITPERN